MPSPSKRVDIPLGPDGFLCIICSVTLPFLHLILPQQSSHQYQAVRLSNSLGRQRLSETKTHRPAASQSHRDQPSVHRKLIDPATTRGLELSCNIVLKLYQRGYLPAIRERSSSIYTASRVDNEPSSSIVRTTRQGKHKEQQHRADTSPIPCIWILDIRIWSNSQPESSFSSILVTVNRPPISCRLVKSSRCVDSTDLSQRSKLPHLPAHTDPAFHPHKLSGL